MDQHIKDLYSPQVNDQSSLVPHGQLPAQSRKGAPDWENKTRKRMHNLLSPKLKASPAEVRVLRDVGIRLKERVQGRPERGLHIDPDMLRESELNSVVTGMDSAQAIEALYSQQDNEQPPLVPHGQLPTSSRKGAPDWENKARQRMHHLLRPDKVASPAEVQALRDAGIRLKERVQGRPERGLHIDPDMPRHSERNSAQAKVDGAVAIARLYMPQDKGQPSLVPHGRLPAYSRRDAPAWENKARHRMHNLLSPKLKASPAEVRVLRDVGIRLKERVQGRPERGLHIDPDMQRESRRQRQGGAEQGPSALRTGVPGPVYAQESGYTSSADPSAGHQSAIEYRETDYRPSAPTSSGHLGHGYGYPPRPDATPTDYYAGTISNNYDASTFYNPFQDLGQSAPAGTYSALPSNPYSHYSTAPAFTTPQQANTVTPYDEMDERSNFLNGYYDSAGTTHQPINPLHQTASAYAPPTRHTQPSTQTAHTRSTAPTHHQPQPRRRGR